MKIFEPKNGCWYVFCAKANGRALTKHPTFKKFKIGNFLGHNKNEDTRPVKTLEESTKYDTGWMIGDGYDDFVMADLFDVITIAVDSFFERLITKSKKDEVIALDPSAFFTTEQLHPILLKHE